MGKVLKYGALAGVLIALILLLVPWLFRSQIFEQIKTEANKNLNGVLKIEAMSLHLFRDFPNLTLTLEGLSFNNDDTFDGEELFAMQTLRAELDLVSVFTGDVIKVEEIQCINPTFKIRVKPDGRANYDIAKPSSAQPVVTETSQEEPSNFQINLKRLIIQQLNLNYVDEETNSRLALENGDLSLSGDFTQTETDVETVVDIAGITFSYDDINYLTKAGLKADINANYNSKTGRVTLTDNNVVLNKLHVIFTGWVESAEEKVGMDLNFKAPHSEFKEILSLVPTLYMHDFEDIQTSGRFAMQGNITGDYYYEGETYPAFKVATDIKNGMFKYAASSASVSDLNMNLVVDHPGGLLDALTIAITEAHAMVAGSPFDMRLRVNALFGDPFIDFALQTKLDFEKLAEIFPVDGTSLSGMLEVDAHVVGKTSDFENANLDDVVAEGFLNSQRIIIQTASLNGSVVIDTLYTAITPKAMVLKPLTMKIGSSDFSGSGQLYNAVGYAMADDTLNGVFTIASKQINVTELMGLLASDAPDLAVDGSAPEGTAQPFAVPTAMAITLNLKADTILYDDMTLSAVSGQVAIENEIAALNDVRLNFCGGILGLDGAYSMQTGQPKFDMDLNLRNVDAATAFQNLNTIQMFAPVAESAVGRFGGNLSLSTILDNNYMPVLGSMTSSGSLLTSALALQPEVLKKIGEIISNASVEKVRIKDADLNFKIENGRVDIKPVDLLLGNIPAKFYGSQGLDQTLDYHLSATVPLSDITLPEAFALLGVSGGKIPVSFSITGTVSKPIIKPVFGEAEGIKEQVTQTINKVVDAAKDTAISIVNKEAEKILADARKAADALLANARAQSDQIKAEAKVQADKLKAEARKQADQLIKEAKGDPFKELAAKTAATKVIKKADEQIDALLKQSNLQADKLVADAQKEADKILREAEEKAKITK